MIKIKCLGLPLPVRIIRFQSAWGGNAFEQLALTLSRLLMGNSLAHFKWQIYANQGSEKLIIYSQIPQPR